MNITELRNDLKSSMINKDAERTSVIRMLLSALNYSAMANNKKLEQMTEDEIDTVVLKEIKARNEAIEQIKVSGNTSVLEKEISEVNILKEFAPKQMDEIEIMDKIKQILSSKTDIAVGPATGLVMKELRGKADPGLVSKLVSSFLKA